MWESIAGVYVLERYERTLLIEACKTADLIIEMSEQIETDGLTLPWGSDGQVRAHPLINHLSTSRALLARLLATLRIPTEDPQITRAQEIRRRQFRRSSGGAS